MTNDNICIIVPTSCTLIEGICFTDFPKTKKQLNAVHRKGIFTFYLTKP